MRKITLLLSLFSLSLSGFSQNEFAFDMYSIMDKSGNILFSPTSIKTAFAMAYEGANSQTQAEFEKVFGFKDDNSAFFKEVKHLKGVAEISNSIWILTNYSILKSYTDKLNVSFDATPNFTDFKNDPEGSAKRMNAWIDKSTNGMIKEMLSAGDIEAFKMALVNAIYFKQDWRYTFDKKDTEKKDFTNADSTKSSLDMMHLTRFYSAYQGTNEKVIELPYEDDKTSMIVVLPNSMEKYAMTNNIYTELISRLSLQKVNLDLPKFTFETPTFELTPFLQQMGLQSAFSDGADFSGMRSESDLKIGTALHKAKIIVNEKGTEAAAVTVIGMATRTSVSAPPPPPIMEMRVNKPFYYFIKDNETGAILFMGRMNSLLDKE